MPRLLLILLCPDLLFFLVCFGVRGLDLLFFFVCFSVWGLDLLFFLVCFGVWGLESFIIIFWFFFNVTATEKTYKILCNKIKLKNKTVYKLLQTEKFYYTTDNDIITRQYFPLLGIELLDFALQNFYTIKWAPSSEFVSSSILSWQISTAHVQPLRGARDLAFCLKVPLDSLLVWASREGSGETARMRRLAWTFAARIGDKYQIRLTRSKCSCY